MPADLVSAEEARGLLDALHDAEVPYGDGWRPLAAGVIGTRNGVSIGECWHPAVTNVCAAAPALARTVVALSEERDRLARILACERGEWAPEGWEAKVRNESLRWVRVGSARPGRVTDAVHGKCRDGRYGWHWWDRTIDADGEVIDTHDEGYAPTALEAIEAADAAAREVSGG